MNTTIAAGLFIGYKVGQTTSISISHLQFVDDTLLLGEKKVGLICEP